MAVEIFKAAAIARDLKQRLELSTEQTVVETRDSENYPVLTVQKGADTVAIKVLHDKANDGRIDGIGQAQVAYTPHKIYVSQEETATQDAGFNIEILNEVTKSGTRVIVKKVADLGATNSAANVEDDSTFNALDAVADIKSDLINPLTSQV